MNISNNHKCLSYNIVNSKKGYIKRRNIQNRNAVANIIVGDKNEYLKQVFRGLVVFQFPNHQIISYKLDKKKIAITRTSVGNIRCLFGLVIKTNHVKGPYKLIKSTNHNLEVTFTTNDNRLHKNCFYQVDLSFNFLENYATID